MKLIIFQVDSPTNGKLKSPDFLQHFFHALSSNTPACSILPVTHNTVPLIEHLLSGEEVGSKPETLRNFQLYLPLLFEIFQKSGVSRFPAELNALIADLWTKAKASFE